MNCIVAALVAKRVEDASTGWVRVRAWGERAGASLREHA